MQLQPLSNPPKKEEKHGSSLFKSSPKKEISSPNYSPDIISLGRRVRILEEKHISTRNKIELIEQNMLNRHKNISTEVKTIDSDIMEIKRDVSEIKDRLLMLIKEFQMTAKQEEVAVLKKYIDMWEPIRFVTRNEVRDIIKEVIEDK